MSEQVSICRCAVCGLGVRCDRMIERDHRHVCFECIKKSEMKG